MKSVKRAILGVAMGMMAAALVPAWDLELADGAAALLNDRDYFAAAIVSNRTLYPVRNREITIPAEPFAIVVVMHEPDGLLVNASATPEFYEGIRSRRTLPEILDEPAMFMGMAEYLFNEEQTLYVSSTFPHYVFFNAFDEHRYDFVHLTPDRVIGYRTVRYLLPIDNDSVTASVAEWDRPLYLSFYYTLFENGERVELQRATIKLTFNG
ncbi:MAG: hypothetical protein ACOC1I_03070 [Spirochaetota bacterium]